ncbi:MAG: D-alanyl-D-alanine carboxypeptidase/D-alanyl-D-alanine-endopeptidase [Pseudomonadota bacterium]
MSSLLTRRFVLSGLAAAAAGPALANAPTTSIRPVPRGEVPPKPAPPPATGLIQAAGLGGAVAYQVVNAETGELVEEFNPGLRLPPASVAKAATAFFALSRLSGAHRFDTSLLATGPVSAGRVEGDLILRGAGDPTLDTDALGALIASLKERGIHEVAGNFRVDASALPAVPHIDPGQPDHVGYNPAISGLNLNFNRVHFEWKRSGGSYAVSMQARAQKFRPEVRIARMSVEDRAVPIYTYDDYNGVDSWTVARRALGDAGSRWLPVSRPTDYAAEVFMTLARSHGIVLARGFDADGVQGTPIVTRQSEPLKDMLRGMLRYSTNLTAEAIGLSAAQANGVQPESLIRSAREMNTWLNRDLGTHSCGFVDHSGLGYGSRVSPADMVHLMRAARQASELPEILRAFRVDAPGVKVLAKTGTLNFVSALSGFVDAPGTPPLAFAILTADMPRRDAIPVAERERPPGGRAWAGRSRNLQRRLIERWVSMASS